MTLQNVSSNQLGLQPQGIFDHARNTINTAERLTNILLAAGPNQQLGTLSGQGVQPQDVWSEAGKIAK
ncbi:hypothetical protein JDS81_29600, partial [Bacillus cereus group sp. N31]|uniref:hypothetical protein n=1 Tax=Bacillus cereus group sp. N31 TaxID=2794594 RepID=UPI0018F37472